MDHIVPNPPDLQGILAWSPFTHICLLFVLDCLFPMQTLRQAVLQILLDGRKDLAHSIVKPTDLHPVTINALPIICPIKFIYSGNNLELPLPTRTSQIHMLLVFMCDYCDLRILVRCQLTTGSVSVP